ncbi:MAG: hypothetical protein ACREDR_08610, partial [Blastocatellia bacterium]
TPPLFFSLLSAQTRSGFVVYPDRKKYPQKPVDIIYGFLGVALGPAAAPSARALRSLKSRPLTSSAQKKVPEKTVRFPIHKKLD